MCDGNCGNEMCMPFHRLAFPRLILNNSKGNFMSLVISLARDNDCPSEYTDGDYVDIDSEGIWWYMYPEMKEFNEANGQRVDLYSICMMDPGAIGSFINALDKVSQRLKAEVNEAISIVIGKWDNGDPVMVDVRASEIAQKIAGLVSIAQRADKNSIALAIVGD